MTRLKAEIAAVREDSAQGQQLLKLRIGRHEKFQQAFEKQKIHVFPAKDSRSESGKEIKNEVQSRSEPVQTGKALFFFGEK